ncbi:GerW family sporulation protein [Candidatus Clostridium radicumherbarum]|uniref:GerW family sporulation protein n=1 Tax=Candidatus Clostridium radicumherbarum TaxID=3381662 RepID=A0ABW8TST5_9CLOT
MDNHPIDNLMKTTMEHIKEMVDVNTIIGDAIEAKDGSIIIPISRVCFGFAAGGSEFNSKEEKKDMSKFPFGGGTGAGVTVKPVAFLVIHNESVRILPVEYDNPYEKFMDSIPQFIDMIKGLTCKNKGDNKTNETTVDTNETKE